MYIVLFMYTYIVYVTYIRPYLAMLKFLWLCNHRTIYTYIATYVHLHYFITNFGSNCSLMEKSQYTFTSNLAMLEVKFIFLLLVGMLCY